MTKPRRSTLPYQSHQPKKADGRRHAGAPLKTVRSAFFRPFNTSSETVGIDRRDMTIR